MHEEARIPPLFLWIAVMIAVASFLLGTLLSSASRGSELARLETAGAQDAAGALEIAPVVVAQNAVAQDIGIQQLITACLPNNGFLDFMGLTNFVSPATPRSYPAYSEFNATSVDISYSFIDTPTVFGERPLTGVTVPNPWDPANDSGLHLATTVTTTLVTDFSSPVYGLKFLLGDLGPGESVEIRLYDISGTLIPTTEIVSQPIAAFVPNDNTANTISYGGGISSSQGIGGGYLYTSTGATQADQVIFVQMSGQTAVTRVEIEYGGDLENRAIVLSVPFFNLVCAEKEFIPDVIVGQVATSLVITLFNSDGLPQRSDVDFNDALPDNLVLAEVPVTPQCGGVISGVVGGTVLGVQDAGFNLGEATCAITALVSPTLPGFFVNDGTRFSAVANLITDTITATLLVSGVPPMIISPLPPDGEYGDPYTHTFEIAPGAFPVTVTWALITGTLPPSITFDAATATLSGTLTAAGVYSNIVISVTNGIDPDDTQIFTITVRPAPLTITADSLVVQLGFPLPTLTATYEGFKLDDDPSDLDVQAILSTVQPLMEGVFPITVCCAEDPNYVITFIDGTLTVVTNRARGSDLPNVHCPVKPKHGKHAWGNGWYWQGWHAQGWIPQDCHFEKHGHKKGWHR